jgi:hypothetical protein
MALDLIAPEIPNAQQNEGPKLFMSSLGQGLSAFAKFAEIRRQSEDEVLKLATQERIAQDQHAFEREKLYKDSEVQDALTRAHTEYYQKAGDALIMKAQAYTRNASNVVAFNQQKQDLINDVNDQANKLKLNDPAFATKEPVQFAANVMQFEDMFQLSPLPEVKNAIRQYRTIADQQKIELKTGLVGDDGKVRPSGFPKMVPVWQIVKQLQDPLLQDQAMNDLQASGHTSIIKGFEEINGTKVPKDTIVPSAPIKDYIEKAKGVNFQRVPSRVPSAMLKKSDAKGTNPTDFPDPDLPTDSSPPDQSVSSNVFPPTQTDNYLIQAKAAISAGAPRADVEKRLQDMGIDTSQL